MDNAIGFRNTYPGLDSNLIWNQMDKFIPQLNFKPIVTQHML